MYVIYHDVVEGKPVAQGRPRFVKRGRFVQVYDPKTSKDYKQFLRNSCSYNEHLWEGAFRVDLDVYVPIPSKFNKAQKEKAEQGIIRPTKKPDVDNYAKGILDAYTGYIWVDDNKCLDLSVHKYYSKTPRIEIIVTAVENVEIVQ